VQEAVANGILVMSVDQEIPVEGVYSVGIDQKEWAKISARWMAEKLGGNGNIVEIEGIPDHPANLARMSGVDEVLKDYPGIKVLGRGTGKWSEATAQQVMANFLLSFPYLDGYWTQENMASGALQAVMAVRKNRFPALVGEGSCQFLNLWNQMLQAHPDFETITVVDPPGVSSSGLRIVVQMLQGKKPDGAQLVGQNGRTFNLPVPLVVTKDNFAEVFETCKDKPENYLLDSILSEDEVQKFFLR
jgi:ribose transport system substrate-binding protein